MSDTQKPLESQIMTGYMLSKGRAKYVKYMNRALRCMKLALKDTNEDLEYEAVQNVDLGDIRESIYLALAAVENVEKAHLRLSDRYQELGYPKLTTEDFAPLGGTRR